MKLTYRGQAYEVPASAQASSTEQPEIKLIYRGHTYDYTPRPALSSESVVANATTVTLIYRGITHQHSLPALKPYQQPRAINWRYQTLKEG